VIQELDALKMSPNPEVCHKARLSINFLLESLQKETWIRGQKMTETLFVAQQRLLPAVSRWTNDDHILDCVAYFVSNFGYQNVVLVTQDKTLHLKARINSFHALTFERLLLVLPSRPLFSSSTNSEPLKRRCFESVFQKENAKCFLSSEKEENTSFDLPVELWSRVFSFVPPSELFRFRFINVNSYLAIESDKFQESTWRQSIAHFFNDRNDVLVPKNVSAKKWYLQWRRQVLPFED
jgi:hypothetical protein